MVYNFKGNMRVNSAANSRNNKNSSRKISKKSQSSTELLLLIGIILSIVVVMVFYMTRPREDIEINKAELALTQLVEYTNKVAGMDIGSKLKLKIDMPSNVEYIDYNENEVSLRVGEAAGKRNDLHKPIKKNIVGFNFMDTQTSQVKPGTYDIILESYPSGVCIYTPNSRDKYCDCFKRVDGQTLPPRTPEFQDLDPDPNPEAIQYIECDIKGKEDTDCSALRYGDIITGLNSKCVYANEPNEGVPVNGKVRYYATNWKGEIILDETVFVHDDEGNFNINGLNTKIENSEKITITATCYDECFAVSASSANLIKGESDIADIPYGTIVPFVLDGDGNPDQRIITVNGEKILYSPFLYNDPRSNDPKLYLHYGQVKERDTFIIRTGFRCEGGECINVKASLKHIGYTPPS